MSTRWATPPNNRYQISLMAPTLDDMIAADDSIRVFEQLLESLSWHAWECKYEDRGQPPIHPRLVAGAILWGLMHGIRTTRGLEQATKYRTDFVWFLSGRTIDHTTFANFRLKFAAPLADLSKQLKRKALELAGSQMKSVGVDGTHVRANSHWRGAKTADALQQALGHLGINIERLLAELHHTDDEKIDELDKLRKELDQANREKAKLERALDVAQERDEKKAKRHSKTPTRVPVTDPDSTLTVNKRGGHAPNHLPVVAVDLESGTIVAEDVLAPGGTEAKSLPDLIASTEDVSGGKPDSVCADSGFADGEVFEELAKDGIDAFIPVTDLKGMQQAERSEPSEPVADDDVKKLPRKGGRFSQACFIYNPESDCYNCPAGHCMTVAKRFNRRGPGRNLHGADYRTEACADCPLASLCIRKGKTSRTITRNQYSHLREAAMRKLASESGKALYKQRAPVVEGVFAVIVDIYGIRQFLTRGHDKVQTEWLWACTAFNISKILKLIAQRATEFHLPAPSARPKTCFSGLFSAICRPWGSMAELAA